MAVTLEQTRQWFDSSPYAVYLGMKLAELKPGYARVSLVLKPEFLNWDGRIQGGVLASLIDQAFGTAMNSLERIYVAVQLSISFMAAAEVDQTLYTEGKVVHAGKSLGVAEMVVSDAKGKVIARATGTTISLGMRENPPATP